MIIVNRIGENIAVSCRDKEYNVMFSKEKFDTLLEISETSNSVKTMDELNELLEKVDALCKDDYKEKVETFHKELFYAPHTHDYYLKLGDKVSSVPIPQALVWRLEESMEKGINVDPIIKFWKRALRNHKAKDERFMNRLAEYVNTTYIDPKKVREYMDAGLGVELAEEKAKTYEVKITQEGLIACYKTSNEYKDKYVADEDGNPKKVNRYTKKFNADTGEIEGDTRDEAKAEDRIFIPYVMGMSGDAFYCEGPNGYEKPGHFIKIGCTHRLPDWSYVDTDDNHSCVKGLHIGGLSYIASWNGADIHTCFVDPMHIGAIPDYGGDKAIRVLQYYVYGSLVAIDHNIYHSSVYAAQTDAQWAEIAKEILEKHGEYKKELQQAQDELSAL